MATVSDPPPGTTIILTREEEWWVAKDEDTGVVSQGKTRHSDCCDSLPRRPAVSGWTAAQHPVVWDHQ